MSFHFSLTSDICLTPWKAFRLLILDWPRSSFGFAHGKARTNFFGQPNIRYNCRGYVKFSSCCNSLYYHFQVLFFFTINNPKLMIPLRTFHKDVLSLHYLRKVSVIRRFRRKLYYPSCFFPQEGPQYLDLCINYFDPFSQAK